MAFAMVFSNNVGSSAFMSAPYIKRSVHITTDSVILAIDFLARKRNLKMNIRAQLNILIWKPMMNTRKGQKLKEN